MNPAFGYQGQPNAFGSQNQGAGLQGAFGVEPAMAPNARVLEAELQAKAYKPQSYNVNSLSFNNDGWYSGGTKLNPLDRLMRQYQDTVTDGDGGTSTVMRDESSPLWQLAKNNDLSWLDDDLERQYQKEQRPLGSRARERGETQRAQYDEPALAAARAPRFAALAKHQISPDEVFDQFRNAGNRDYLFGAYGGNGGKDHYGQHGDPSDPYNWSGHALTRQTDRRGNMAYANSQAVRQALESMPEYQHLTLRDIDKYATTALNKRRWQHYWGSTPGEIAREIAGEMPKGLPKSGQDWISQNNAQWVAERKKAKKSIHKAEDAASGLTGMMSDIGPLGNLLYLIPGVNVAWGALNAAAAAEGMHEKTMKPGQALLKMAMSAYGMNNALGSMNAANPSSLAYENAFDTGAMAKSVGNAASSTPDWASSIGGALENSDFTGAMTAAKHSPLGDIAGKLGVPTSAGDIAVKVAMSKLLPEQKKALMQQAVQKQRQQSPLAKYNPNRAFGLNNFG